MSILVAKMFEADMSEFRFVFSKDACVKTCIYFAVMYVAVMFFNTLTVSKYKLINLLNASKKNEKIKIKNGKFDWIIKSDLLPSPKHYYHWTSDSISDYVKYASPVVAPAAFNHKRKVKLLKNVEMVKQRQGTPRAFTRMLGFKTLKKGSIITAESGGRYAYMVWSKQLPVTNKMDFWITSEKGKWYKIID